MYFRYLSYKYKGQLINCKEYNIAEEFLRYALSSVVFGVTVIGKLLYMY